jgi:hypothetical protein
MVLASVDSDEEDMPTKPEVPPRGQPSSGGMRGGSVFLDRSATTATAAAPTSPPPPRTLEEMGQDELTAWVRGPYFNSDLGQAVRDSHGGAQQQRSRPSPASRHGAARELTTRAAHGRAVGWTAFVGTDGDPSLPRIGARLMTAFGCALPVAYARQLVALTAAGASRRGGDEGKVAIDAFLKQQLHIASIGIRALKRPKPRPPAVQADKRVAAAGHKLTMGIQDLATNPGGHPGGLPVRHPSNPRHAAPIGHKN